MTIEFPSISPNLSIEELISDYLLITGQDHFAVTNEGILIGIVNVWDVKHIPKTRWVSTSVSRIMKPLRKVRTVSSEYPAAHILEQIDQYKLERIPVIDEGKIIGIVLRDSLYRFIKIRTQLKI